MQKFELIGRIGNDAEVKDFNSNQVINFSVAVSETWKDKQGQKQEKTYWYKCAKWSNNVAIAPYIKKGTLVFISGIPEAKSYINNAGELVQDISIKVNDIKLLSSAPNVSWNNSQPAAAKANVNNIPVNAEIVQPEEEDDLHF